MGDVARACLQGEGGKVELVFKGRLHSEENMVFLDTRTDCAGYFGAGEYCFMLSGLQRFVREVTDLQESLRAGEVELSALEDDFSLAIKFGKVGNLEVSTHHAHGGSTWVNQEFKFFSDQSYAGEFVRELPGMIKTIGSAREDA